MLKKQSTRRVRYYGSYSHVPHRSTYRVDQPVNKYGHYRWPILIIGVSGLAAILVLAVLIFNKEEQQVAPQIVQQPKVVLPSLIDDQQLRTTVESVIAANPQLDIGVSVVDAKNNQSYTYGVDVPYVAASVGKIITACLYLDEVQKGNRSLDSNLGDATARVQLQRMITKSDNTAWKLLNDDLGHPALAAYVTKLGVTSYDPEENKIKPSDVSLILTKLYNRQLLDEEHTTFLLANMQTELEEIQFIRKYIPKEIAVSHKAGWLNDRAHDSAIIERDKRPYVLVVFSKARYGDYDFEYGQKLFSELTSGVDAVLAKE